MDNASHLKQAPVKMTIRELHDYISEISKGLQVHEGEAGCVRVAE